MFLKVDFGSALRILIRGLPTHFFYHEGKNDEAINLIIEIYNFIGIKVLRDHYGTPGLTVHLWKSKDEVDLIPRIIYAPWTTTPTMIYENAFSPKISVNSKYSIVKSDL